MRLAAGIPALPFTAHDLAGKGVSLQAYKGKPLLLSFFRSASCPLCSLQVWYLIRAYPRLRSRGLELVSVFESDEDTTLRYVGGQNPPFTTIADPEKKLFRLYGVENSWLGFVRGLPQYLLAIVRSRRKGIGGWMSNGEHNQLPADFLITPDQMIYQAYYGRHIGDRMPLAAIDTFLAHYQEAQP